MKTAVTIPDPLFAAADALAVRSGLSRDELYARALAAYVERTAERPTDEEITARLNQIYSPDETAPDELLTRAQALSIPREDW